MDARIEISWGDAKRVLNFGDVFEFRGMHYRVAGPLRNDTDTHRYSFGSVGPFDFVSPTDDGSYEQISEGFGLSVEGLEADARFVGETL